MWCTCYAHSDPCIFVVVIQVMKWYIYLSFFVFTVLCFIHLVCVCVFDLLVLYVFASLYLFQKFILFYYIKQVNHFLSSNFFCSWIFVSEPWCILLRLFLAVCLSYIFCTEIIPIAHKKCYATIIISVPFILHFVVRCLARQMVVVFQTIRMQQVLIAVAVMPVFVTNVAHFLESCTCWNNIAPLDPRKFLIGLNCSTTQASHARTPHPKQRKYEHSNKKHELLNMLN